MNISVSNLSINRSGNMVKQFADPLTGAVGPLGKNWAQGTTQTSPLVNNIYSMFISINAAPDLTNAMQLSPFGSGAATTVQAGFAFPLPIASSIWGLTQFAQATLVNDTTASSSCEWDLGLMYQPSALFNGYFLEVNKTAAISRIIRAAPNGNNSPGSSPNSTSLGNVTAPTNGTVIRLSVDLDSQPGKAVVTLSYNGVQQNQFTDNTPISGGIPVVSGTNGGSGNVWFRTYSCGAGL